MGATCDVAGRRDGSVTGTACRGGALFTLAIMPYEMRSGEITIQLTAEVLCGVVTEAEDPDLVYM